MNNYLEFLPRELIYTIIDYVNLPDTFNIRKIINFDWKSLFIFGYGELQKWACPFLPRRPARWSTLQNVKRNNGYR